MYVSKLICYARACSTYEQFMKRLKEACTYKQVVVTRILRTSINKSHLYASLMVDTMTMSATTMFH